MQYVLTIYDPRSFFVKALCFGMQHHLLTKAHLALINEDAPKGIVQITKAFGSAYIYPHLRQGLDYLVALVSLYLEHASKGDLHKAAILLRDRPFLSLSKGGSTMIKELLNLPHATCFGMNSGFSYPAFFKIACAGLRDYQQELHNRQQALIALDLACELATYFELAIEDLEELNIEADAVSRTALLAMAMNLRRMPTWVEFSKLLMIDPNRLVIPKYLSLSNNSQGHLSILKHSIINDLPFFHKASRHLKHLFDTDQTMIGRYFWI